MAKDGITLHLAHFSPLIEIDNPDALHPVGASHLEEYLKVMVGEDVPKSPDVQRLSRNLMGSMAIMSTDEEIYDPATPTHRSFGLMLSRIESVIDDTKRATRFIEIVTGYNGATYENSQWFLDRDIQYLMGICDLSTFVMSMTLSIEHPRHRNQNLTEESRTIIGPDQPFSADVKNRDTQIINLAAALGMTRPEAVRNFFRLRKQAVKLIEASDRQVNQSIQAVNAYSKDNTSES